jgi:IS4 transposase
MVLVFPITEVHPMSPEYVDPSAKAKRRRPATPSAPSTPSKRDLLNAGFCLDSSDQPVLPAILDPFAEGGAPAVMVRIALDWIVDEPILNQLFQEAAAAQYTREWALEHFVQVMLDVACGFRPSPRAAWLRRRLDRIASLSAFYRKLNRMELAIPIAVVRHTAQRARELIAAAGALMPESIPGYVSRILDGNALSGTEHRIEPLRDLGAAGLPGKALAIYEPASGLILELVLEENGHAQERSLLDQIVVEPGQLWIADRNFCVRTFLFRIQRTGAFFLVRRHAQNLPFQELTPLEEKGRCATGMVLEQAIAVADTELPGMVHRLRRIVLQLDQPTREGDTEIVLVTNLPEAVSAIACCDAYRERWQVERHFQTLTDLLHCEVPSLGYPRAALFGFSMSVVSGNALAVLKGNLRAVHGEEMAREVSNFELVDQAAEVYPGMMLAVPPEHWAWVRQSPAAVIAGVLNQLAAHVPVERMLRTRRGPKKARTRRKQSGAVDRHVATQKLLGRAKGVGPPGSGEETLTTSEVRSQ